MKHTYENAIKRAGQSTGSSLIKKLTADSIVIHYMHILQKRHIVLRLDAVITDRIKAWLRLQPEGPSLR